MRWWPSSVPPWSGSTCRTKPSRSSLGGGIFDTTDTAFHARVAAGINAVAPRAVLVRLDAPPVLGAALIGLDAEDVPPDALAALRQALKLPEDGLPGHA